MSVKSRHSEEEFFAREEQEKKRRIQETQKHEEEIRHREMQKQLHFMKCPKCGDDLKTIQMSFVELEECVHCGAIVLDRGEFEKLKIADNTVLKSLLEVFKKK